MTPVLAIEFDTPTASGQVPTASGQVRHFVWLGGENAANDKEYLLANKIAGRCCVKGHWGASNCSDFKDLEGHFRIDDYIKGDKDWSDLWRPLARLDEFLQTKGDVLVFCRQGARRAAVFIGIYIMVKTGCSAAAAYEHLKGCRVIVEDCVADDLARFAANVDQRSMLMTRLQRMPVCVTWQVARRIAMGYAEPVNNVLALNKYNYTYVTVSEFPYTKEGERGVTFKAAGAESKARGVVAKARPLPKADVAKAALALPPVGGGKGTATGQEGGGGAGAGPMGAGAAAGAALVRALGGGGAGAGAAAGADGPGGTASGQEGGKKRERGTDSEHESSTDSDSDGDSEQKRRRPSGTAKAGVKEEGVGGAGKGTATGQQEGGGGADADTALGQEGGGGADAGTATGKEGGGQEGGGGTGKDTASGQEGGGGTGKTASGQDEGDYQMLLAEVRGLRANREGENLYNMIAEGDEAATLAMLNARPGLDVSFRDVGGMGVLHRAARTGSWKLVSHLMEMRADPNMATYASRAPGLSTPLICLASADWTKFADKDSAITCAIELVKAMSIEGLRKQNTKENTFAHVAASQGNAALLQCTLNATMESFGVGAVEDILNLTNDRGKSAKDVAMYNRQARDVVEKFGGVNKAPAPRREDWGQRLEKDHKWQRSNYLGFTKRQSQKDQFVSARAASASTGPANPPKPRKPASIADTRFLQKRELRRARCGQCGELKGGNEAGAFWHRHNMPPWVEREAAWECGDWDATWYCTECYMVYCNCSYGAVCDMLGFSARSAKKARRRMTRTAC